LTLKERGSIGNDDAALFSFEHHRVISTVKAAHRMEHGFIRGALLHSRGAIRPSVA
jgi:hypothetical protein